MGSALLSRFDLVFILLDTPDEDRDHLLSEHVMALHAGKHPRLSGAAVRRSAPGEISSISVEDLFGDQTLSERLKVWHLTNFRSLNMCINFEALSPKLLTNDGPPEHL